MSEQRQRNGMFAARLRGWWRQVVGREVGAFRLYTLLATIIGLSFSLYVLHRMYLAQVFAFHDLGLIDDILGSWWNHGRIFYIFDYGINHLSLHFTPSLFLWLPLFGIVQSQFLLVALNAVVLSAAFALGLLSLRRVLRPLFTPGELALAAILFTVVTWKNTFFWNALTAAHYEEFYAFYAVLLLYLLLIEARLWLVIGAYLLCLGSRQDAGFFLFFQLFSLLFAPRVIFQNFPRLLRRITPMALLGIVYTVFVSKVVFPLFGTDQTWHAKRLWGQFGNSFEEIALNMAKDPLRVVMEIYNSAAPDLNASFLLVHFFNPLMALMNNIPGVLFYTTSTESRKFLHYYNSSFLFPGFFVSFIFGLYGLKRLCQHWSVRPKALPTTLAVLALAVALLPSIGRRYKSYPGLNPAAEVEGLSRLAFIQSALGDCPIPATVATDFSSVVYLPNRVGKYLPNHYASADAVFVFRGGSTFTSDFPTSAAFLAKVDADKDFVRMRGDSDAAFYVKRGMNCRS